jgi:Zn-dependent peptidase ImmA (M78 family)/transcriptional regulator with XRE-family HTH domain
MSEKEGVTACAPIEVGRRLRHARERCGFKQGEVCIATGIGESSLSDFERGKRSPSLDQLSALAAHYDRPLGFFFEEGEPALEVVLWRERPASGAEKCESEFRQDCRRYRDLEVWCKDESPCALPEPHRDSRSPDFRWAEDLAFKVRNELRLGDRPALTLLQGLEEDCGVKVFHREFEPTGTAACSIDPYFGAGVLLNAKSTQRRRNFDLAHELFHLVTWKLFRTSSPANNTKHEEQLADKFASTLLLPEEGVRSAVTRRCEGDRLSLPAVFDIAREFEVSVEALLWRLHWIFNWSDSDRTKELIGKAKLQARIFEKPAREETTVPARPPRFHALAVKALRNGEISVGRFAEYLGISRREAMTYLEEESGASEAIELSPS